MGALAPRVPGVCAGIAPVEVLRETRAVLPASLPLAAIQQPYTIVQDLWVGTINCTKQSGAGRRHGGRSTTVQPLTL
jgi:hypothetical protein